MKHLRTNIVAYVALFLALSAGAYAAGLAPNSVRSKHIKNGQVKTQDVADDTTSGALTGTDVANESLGGADLQANTLTGGQVNEASLGTVPTATQGGRGRYGSSQGECNPTSKAYVSCSTVAIPHAKPGRLLITGQVTGRALSLAWAHCQLEVNGQAITASRISIILDGNYDVTQNATLVAVSDVLPAGSQTVGIACNQESGYFSAIPASVTAVALSDE